VNGAIYTLLHTYKLINTLHTQHNLNIQQANKPTHAPSRCIRPRTTNNTQPANMAYKTSHPPEAPETPDKPRMMLVAKYPYVLNSTAASMAVVSPASW